MWNWRELWIWELKEFSRKKNACFKFQYVVSHKIRKKIHFIKHVDLRKPFHPGSPFYWRNCPEGLDQAPDCHLGALALLIRVWGPVWNLGVMNSFRFGAMKARLFLVFFEGKKGSWELLTSFTVHSLASATPHVTEPFPFFSISWFLWSTVFYLSARRGD